jgi:CDP-diacylglycerol---serine O-phosphatidyltransferase
MIKKHIPNFITCLNLLCGCMGITAAFSGNNELAAIFIGFAALFDFLDGMAARLLHVKSDIGKDLDSLADVISFGLLPATIVFQLMKASTNLPGNTNSLNNPYLYIAFLVPVFSALRLAKFNHDTRQTDSFIGLPTPASALFLGSFPLIISQIKGTGHLQFLLPWMENYYLLAMATIIISGLLVSEIPLFSLKVKNLAWKDNRAQYILLLFSLGSLLLIGYAALPLTILIYILLSLVI